jgi:DNA-binding CsgD family transcriptional regulator
MLIDNIIGAIGSPDFGKALFATFHETMAARQVVVHRFHENAPVEPLIQESEEKGDWVRTLVRRYVGGYFAHDPFRPMLEMPREREICVLAVDMHEIRHAEYRDRLYGEPGLAGKMALILRQPREVISVSLYRDRSEGAFAKRDIAKIKRCGQTLAAALEKHLSLMDNVVSPTVQNIEDALIHLEALRPLSGREASVCARVVMGYTNEAASLDLGLSYHSVATYRRRAYDKLGITSQNELFALLLSRSHLHLTRRVQSQMTWRGNRPALHS